jgi:exodeoxyribonuclease VII large subunit
MSRLPFDPENVRGPEPPPEKPARRERKKHTKLTDASQLTVSQLSQLIKTTLEESIASPLRVIGQVSNLNVRDHWYFSLKDDAAVVSCVAWASAASKFGFRPKEGDEVVATGHVSHFPPQGRTQFYVTKLEPVGAGVLEIEFRRLCEELRTLGYFDPARKKPLPMFPRRIAVITSATGAAVQDVITTAAQRCKAVGLVIVDVRVQGDGAKEQVARAIRWVDSNHMELGVDAILVTRGGGSIEDLWAFNERLVAEAAYKCSIPLVAAIGHESDTTLIELIADVRASTPTQAAMLLVPDASQWKTQVAHHEQRIAFLVHRLVERQRERLLNCEKHLHNAAAHRFVSQRSRIEQLAARLAKLQPATIASLRHQRVAVMEDRLEQAISRRLRAWREAVRAKSNELDETLVSRIVRSRERLGSYERQLIAIDPRLVLRRGYSYTTKHDGSLVRSIGDVRSGDRMQTHVADGAIESIVGSSAKRQPRKRTGSADADQLDLFD